MAQEEETDYVSLIAEKEDTTKCLPPRVDPFEARVFEGREAGRFGEALRIP